jgi:hypothetical protein
MSEIETNPEARKAYILMRKTELTKYQEIIDYLEIPTGGNPSNQEVVDRIAAAKAHMDIIKQDLVKLGVETDEK